MKRSGGQRAWLRPAGSMLALLVVYYAAPFSAFGSIERAATGLGLTIAGVVALGWAITTEVRRQLAGVSTTRIPGLFMLLGLVVFVFSLGYYLLESSAPGQMTGLETRTDALYFTLSTLGTVGFGDVHAEGQMARALVSLQIVFDVVFVAALAATLTGKVRAGMSGGART